jgi:LPS export ABC transporter protein LptC
MAGRRHEWLETIGLVACAAVLVWSLDAWLGRQSAAMPAMVSGASDGSQHPLPVPVEPDVAIRGFHFLHLPTDPRVRRVWELTASSAELSESRHVAVLNEIEATLTPQPDGAVVKLMGERGDLDLQRMDFEVSGASRPLSLQFDGQYRLTTSRLLWQDHAGLLTTDQPIELTGGEFTVTGTGLRWSAADNTVSIPHRVRMVVAP